MKEYRKNELKTYVIGNVLILLLLTGMFDGLIKNVSSDGVKIIESLFGSAIIGSVVYIYTFLLDSFMPSKAKDAIAYFPTGRPGDKIFTEIEKRDPDSRFTKEQVKQKYVDVYKGIKVRQQKKYKEGKKELRKYQNSQWYRIYKPNQKDESIYTAQQDFLLVRDMGSMTIMLAALYFIAIIFKVATVDWRIIAILTAEFLLSNLAAKSKAKRFAYNVIATDLNPKKETEKEKSNT